MLVVMQLGVMVIWPCSTAEGFRRRAQALAWTENLSLLHRSLLPMPVWYKYFEDSGMGMVLCALTTGMHIAAASAVVAWYSPKLRLRLPVAALQ